LLGHRPLEAGQRGRHRRNIVMPGDGATVVEGNDLR